MTFKITRYCTQPFTIIIYTAADELRNKFFLGLFNLNVEG